MADLVQEIEAEIAGAKAASARQSVGVIREIGDGVAKVEGLGDVMYNEMVDFGHGITGLALNLDETEVGVVVLGDYTQLAEGGEVRATGKLLQVPVGKGLLGRVVNTLGEPLDEKGPIASEVAYPVEKLAPGIIRRRPVGQPVQTGIMLIDAMIPIGRGQRELIIGDRSTGKTTICIDTIINQARLNAAAEASGDTSHRPLYSIYVAIGQKQSTIARIIARAGTGRRDAVHHHRGRAGVGFGDQPVPRAFRRGGDRRMVHGSRHGRAHRLRRSVQARGGLPAGVAPVEAPVGPRGLSGRCVLPPQPAARARRACRRKVRRRLADRFADHRNAVGGRVRLHPDQRHLDHRRTGVPGNRPVLPGDPAGGLGRHLGVARRIGRAAQSDEAGRRPAQRRSRAVPGAGRLRPVRVGARCGIAGQDRSRQARRRAFQAAAVQPDTGRSAGGNDLGRAERIHGRRAG